MPTFTATTQPTTAPARALWDERQTAEHLSLSPRTLQAWRVKGGGPPYVKVGAAVRYKPEAVAAWVAALPECANTSGPAAA